MNLYDEALKKFESLYKKALASDLKEPTAMTLATSDLTGRPSIRTVLLKSADARGFMFVTNMTSRKGREIMSNPRGALCFYWAPLDYQITVEGPITLVSEQDADAYWKTRPRESQLGAWASLQSRPLESYEMLLERVKEMEKKYRDAPVPRPPHWTGCVLTPERFEFLKLQVNRLHERMVYEKKDGAWTNGFLYP